MENSSALPKKVKVLFYISILLIALSVGVATYSYLKMKSPQDANTLAQKEVKQLMIDIGKHAVLPDNELPTLATVSDPNKLKGQSFFASAEVGDKVLIFVSAKKAILWRPSISKIIEISSINSTSLTSTSVND